MPHRIIVHLMAEISVMQEEINEVMAEMGITGEEMATMNMAKFLLDNREMLNAAGIKLTDACLYTGKMVKFAPGGGAKPGARTQKIVGCPV